jgi:LacI family transcriptional regulator
MPAITPSQNERRGKTVVDLACRRQSLAETVAATIVAALQAGHWTQDLPGERRLCEILQVSRITLRPALQTLERQGWIENTPGQRRRITRPVQSEGAPARGGKIILISPLPIQNIEPFVLLGLDLLRELLARRNIMLAIETRPECYDRLPGAALERLCRDFHPDVWLLWRSTRQIQTWFCRQGLRHVVVGTAFDPAASPCVDIDHAATARHAASTFGRLGHHRIAVIVQDTRLAGDRASVEGFKAGARDYEGGGLQAETISHDGTPAGIFRSIDRLVSFKPRPTGIFSAGGMQTIAIMTRLLQLGVRVPEEISVISRDDDPALDFVSPAPARYYRPPIKFARGVFRQIERQLALSRTTHAPCTIFPDFLPKETVAPREAADSRPR